MASESKRLMREKADQLHLRGLRCRARYAEFPSIDHLKAVAELWQQAWDLYRRAGDKHEARRIQRSLVAMYKTEYARAGEERAQRRGIARIFRDWAMFFKVGCVGFGGPMAVFSVLEDELVQNKDVLTHKDFLEGAVLGNVLPGPVTMDIVTYTGYKLRKWYGALMSTIAFILPAFLIMLGIAVLYEHHSLTPTVEAVLTCLGAAVTGLILSVGLTLSKAELASYREACFLIGAFVASSVFDLDIVMTVGVAGLLGVIVYRDDPETAMTLEAEVDDNAA